MLVWTAAAVKAGLRGSVINVSSIGGLGVEPGIGWYNVTKAAVLHITKQLSFELAPDIRVNALAPGVVKTKLAAALWEGPGEERIAALIPLRRLGVPDDIATAALFLASDAASWVTGQTLVVDGGQPPNLRAVSARTAAGVSTPVDRDLWIAACDHVAAQINRFRQNPVKSQLINSVEQI